MNWKFKALVFRALAMAPFGTFLHYQLQRRVTKEWPRRPQVLDDLLTAALRIHAAVGATEAPDASALHLLEIGAGRDLAVAVALRLLGVAKVTCVDVSGLAKIDLIAHAARYLAGRLGVPCPSLSSWGDLERFGIRYIAPARLEAAELPPAGFDAFYSVDTLEHILPDDLAVVLATGRRLLRPSGAMVHLVDYGDHYARSGQGVSRFNFLAYSDVDWRPYNSRLQYVNRLRHSRYLRMFHEAGMRVIEANADHEVMEPELRARLAPEFANLAADDLSIVRAMIVAVPEERTGSTDHRPTQRAAYLNSHPPA